MRQFPLKVAGETLNFDTDGRVLDAADNVKGQWSTTAENKIQFLEAAGDTTDIDVGWVFNDENQLTITQANKVVFTILNTTDALPRFQLNKKNQLVVDPDGDGDFEFVLNCLFGINADGNLIVSINGKQSTLDGYVEDSKSRFRFQFADLDLPTLPSSLVLSGAWERKKSAENEIRLQFVLDDPALAIGGKPLELPATAKVDSKRNHLTIAYKSKSHGQREVQFLGSLEIKPNFTLVFRIDSVKDGGVRKSKIEVETTFDWAVAQGSTSLTVGRTKTATSQTVDIGGAVQARFKNGQLDWTFDYRKSTAGGKSLVTIATGVVFVFKQNKIMLQYKKQGKVEQLDVTAKLQQQDFTLSGGLSIINDPQGRGLKAFLGFSW